MENGPSGISLMHGTNWSFWSACLLPVAQCADTDSNESIVLVMVSWGNLPPIGGRCEPTGVRVILSASWAMCPAPFRDRVLWAPPNMGTTTTASPATVCRSSATRGASRRPYRRASSCRTPSRRPPT